MVLIWLSLPFSTVAVIALTVMLAGPEPLRRSAMLVQFVTCAVAWLLLVLHYS